MTESPFAERFSAFDENYKKVKEDIENACLKAKRSPDEITLLAATKTVPAEVINYAVSKGIKVIGENRVQELLEKYDTLDVKNADLQFIGRLQTNKVKYITDKVSLIQSVDSLKLAREISRLCTKEGRTMKILVEVNIGEEESKGGISPGELNGFVDELSGLSGITVSGLMAIPPADADESRLKKCFLQMKQYYVDMSGKKRDNIKTECLSMGMSSDYPLAIECGATMVRVGSALFGKRKYS